MKAGIYIDRRANRRLARLLLGERRWAVVLRPPENRTLGKSEGPGRLLTDSRRLLPRQ
jgi:hypothetical protein